MHPTAGWFHRSIVSTGRLRLFAFFVAFMVAFLFIRFSVRMIRAQVRWWPGNVTPGGVHVHHVVFGLVGMCVGGVSGLAVASPRSWWGAVAAALMGIGMALVLDEFALVLHLDDVYWSERGRLSVDAIFIAFGLCGLILLGMRPLGIGDDDGDPELAARVAVATVILINLLLVVTTLLKGKIWTGLLGVFIGYFSIVGAIRLARPGSPWARWRYHPDRRRGAKKLARAERRENRYRKPVVRAKIALQNAIAGRPDPPPS